MAKKIDLEFSKNEDVNRLSVSDLNRKLEKVYLGGGKKKIESHHAKGKLTARERIDYLLDKKSPRIEIGAFAEKECMKNKVVVLRVEWLV